MDGGGRGGGRGKGKKGKAARQKKAAAAAASQKKAVNAHHGGKKAGAAHSNVQVVAVLKSNAASPAAAHGDHNATAALKPSGPAPHEHSQPKPKRKKAKAKASGAANMLLKKQAVSEAAKQAPAAPTPTKSKPMQETAQAKSPTTRNVAGTSPKVMTPTAADTATTAKPHIVSLTGGKRKRKRRAASHDAASTSESTAHVATVAPPKTEVQAVGEKAQQIKMQAGVVNIPVTSPPAAVPAKTEALTATTPKRKIAKTAILNSTPPEDETQKTKGGVAISAPSSKNDEFPNPRDDTRNIQAKSRATGAASDVALNSDIISTVPKAKDSAKVPQEKKVIVGVSPSLASSSKPVKPAVVVLKRKLPKVDEPKEKDPAQWLSQTTQKNTSDNGPDGTTKTSEVNTSLKKRKIDDIPATGIDNRSPPAKRVTTHTSPNTPASVSSSCEITTLQQPPPVSVSASAPRTDGSEGKGQLPPKPLFAKAITDPLMKTMTAMSDEKLSTPCKKELNSGFSAVELPTQVETGGNDAPTQESRSPGAHALSTVNQQEPAKVSTEPVDDKKKESVHTPTRPGNLGTLAGAADTKTATEHHSISKVGAGKTATAVKVQPPAHTKSAASIASKLGFTPQDTAAKVEMGDAVYAVLDNSSSRNQSSCKGKMEHVASSINDTHPRAGASDAPVKTEPVGIIMDSRAYVENMMSEISEADGKDSESTDLNAVLPTRPQNSWGASFGLVPPAQSAPRPARTLSTTPLSSWFLSKGPANFVQQVHFSDDDDDGDDHSHSVIGKNLSGALPKKGKQSSGKKNAFLESLTTQSSWRSWYGNVNLQNLLDPPLAHVPDSLLRYKESPPALPAADNAVEGNLASGEKKSALESLEEDIRREKQRGSEFGEQLLQMLQGKTVSGKLLEEEFSQIVH